MYLTRHCGQYTGCMRTETMDAPAYGCEDQSTCCSCRWLLVRRMCNCIWPCLSLEATAPQGVSNTAACTEVSTQRCQDKFTPACCSCACPGLGRLHLVCAACLCSRSGRAGPWGPEWHQTQRAMAPHAPKHPLSKGAPVPCICVTHQHVSRYKSRQAWCAAMIQPC